MTSTGLTVTHNLSECCVQEVPIRRKQKMSDSTGYAIQECQGSFDILRVKPNCAVKQHGSNIRSGLLRDIHNINNSIIMRRQLWFQY